MYKKTGPCALSSALAMALWAGTAQAQDSVNLHDLTQGDPFFFTSDQRVEESNGQKELVGVGRPDRTHSRIPHLPVYFGYMNTNYTYRFVTVAEQVMTMIGEGKHGLWRVQENGTVREYLRKGATGLKQGADILAPESLATIAASYGAFLPEEGWDGYKYPDQQLTADGRLNFVDLPITHPKYGGRYAGHAPVDLPSFYCTLSEDEFPYARAAVDFAFRQPAANKPGPLGKRAGLDIKENYTNVLRLQHFPDARTWVNVGQEGEDELHVKWEAVDISKTSAEYYLVERPFFNKPYLFVMAVFDNQDNDDFQYVRPDGAYYASVKSGQGALKTSVTQRPRFHLENGAVGEVVGLPVFGVHHPNRAAFGGGGACPFKGGDWGRYPDPNSGSGWPTQYEEVTPLCDGVLTDIKFYSNLDGRDWSEQDKYLANAGVGTRTVTYTMQPGDYGTFTDPYNTARGARNPEARHVPAEVTLTYAAVEPAVTYTRPAPEPATQMAMLPSESTSCRPIPPAD